MVSSQDADARVLPSGLIATLHTKSVCPVKVEICLPVATFHNLIVLSLLAEARDFAIWAYCNTYNSKLMSCKGRNFFACGAIPKFNCFITVDKLSLYQIFLEMNILVFYTLLIL